MRFLGLVLLLAALSCCTGRQADDRGTGASAERESERAKVTTVDPQRRAQEMAATEAAYAANKDRKDRVFGTAFEDIWWQRPAANRIKRISTGDAFLAYDYNGGYPSFFILKHGDQSLRGEFKRLYVDAYPYEPIVLISPAQVHHQADRAWTAGELNLIASFFQTQAVEMRRDTIASMRESGHGDMANAKERLPMPKVSVVVDTQGLISTSSRTE